MALLCVGCGSNPSGADGGDEGGSNEGGSDGGGGDSGVTTKFYGSVIVANTNTSTSMRYDIFGLFGATSTSSGGTTTCTASTEGACTFQDCASGDGGVPGDAGAPIYLSAGTLDVIVGSNTFTTTRMANGEYRAQAMSSLYMGGESVRAKATGDPMGAPAFDLSVTAPARITVTMPAYPPMGSITISRAQPFSMVWTGGVAGTVNVAVSTYPAGHTLAVSCKADASTGGTTIPTNMLAKLASGNGFLSVFHFTSTAMVQGDWGLGLYAYNTAVDPSGRGVTLVNAIVQ